MKETGLNLVEVKEINRALIMQLICTHEAPTRNFLAEKSGLTKMTLTNITTELIQKGYIQDVEMELDIEDGEARPIGRSPKVLALAPQSPVVAGIWISKKFVFGVLTDLKLNSITGSRIEFEEKETKESILEKVSKLGTYLTTFSTRPLLGLGIAAIGIINSQEGVMERAISFFNVDQLHIKDYLEEKLKVPVYVKNDMQASGLCELYYGLGRQLDDFLYIGLSNGVGAAAVSRGGLLRGARGSFGELGHATIDYRGPKCECGSRGCLELYTSKQIIISQINEAAGTDFHSLREAMEYTEFNQEARRVLQDTLDKLAYAINNLINILDIHNVVIGHSGSFIPESGLDYLKQTLDELSLFKEIQEVSIYRSSFSTNNPLYGSVCVVLDRLFNGQIPI